MTRSRLVVNPRRDELLDLAVDHVIAHGVQDLSLRTLAAGVGVAPNALKYHFGQRQELVATILARLNERIRAIHAGTQEADNAPDRLRAFWASLSEPQYRKVWQTFFEFYALALRDPEHNQQFLEHVAQDWILSTSERLSAANGMDPAQADSRATLVVAAVRGLILDHLAGGDPSRIASAVEQLATTLAQWSQQGTTQA